MASADLLNIERELRRAYEFGRLRLALFGVLPLVVLAAAVAGLSLRPWSVVVFGSAVVGLSAWLLWYGREPRRAVLPGVVAGLVPLFLSVCANLVHACGAEGCSTRCVPACALGGVVAGVGVVVMVKELGAPLRSLWVASALALLTGSMGCACIGYAGIGSLGLGFVVGFVPGLLLRWFR